MSTTMTQDKQREQQLARARAQLDLNGYVVLENVISRAEAAHYNALLQRLLDRERAEPYDPGDGPVLPGDAEIEAEFAAGWHLSDAERARMMRRVRYTRAQNLDTPWPVSAAEVCNCFTHLPTLFDADRSERIFNLINKEPAFADLIMHPAVLPLMYERLGRDCILFDVSANCVGPRTSGGGWHVDTPLTAMPEPWPDFTLSIQTVWMLTDFSAENGGTNVVPGSHRMRHRPQVDLQPETTATLTGPAGSVAIWLSETWHRHGPNTTDASRPGVIVQYGRCWIKPFVDLKSSMDPAIARGFSPELRYMLGYSANAIVRG